MKSPSGLDQTIEYSPTKSEKRDSVASSKGKAQESWGGRKAAKTRARADRRWMTTRLSRRGRRRR
eukprot:206777-Pyramimonas_sp.AAC.1